MKKDPLKNYSTALLRERLVIWKLVQQMFDMPYTRWSNLTLHTVRCICFSISHLHDMRIAGVKNPFSSCDCIVKEVYPEIAKYEPVPHLAHHGYWWEKGDDYPRKKVISSIVKDIEMELETRNGLHRMSNVILHARIRFWNEVLLLFVNNTNEIYATDLRSAAICFAVNSVNSEPDFRGYGWVYPNAGVHTMKKHWPEMFKYKPKDKYRMLRENGKRTESNYWWSPYTEKGRLRRIEVIKLIIEDLKKEVEYREKISQKVF